MKLLSLIVAALPLVVPLGGTVVELPLDGKADAAKLEAARSRIRLETWDCARHPLKDPGKLQLLTCKTCGQPLAKVAGDPRPDAKDQFFKVDVAGQRLRIMSGPGTGVGFLRQSNIDKALEGTGLTLRPTGWLLHEHVLLEVDAQAKASRADLEKALKPFGSAEIDGKGGLVLLLLDRHRVGHDHGALVDAVKASNHAVKDTLWIMNQCAGELVTVK